MIHNQDPRITSIGVCRRFVRVCLVITQQQQQQRHLPWHSRALSPRQGAITQVADLTVSEENTKNTKNSLPLSISHSIDPLLVPLFTRCHARLMVFVRECGSATLPR